MNGIDTRGEKKMKLRMKTLAAAAALAFAGTAAHAQI